MIRAPLPADEAERLAALESYSVLDTEAELGFDDLTALAATICNAPIALVSLVDANRQWFKSHYGLNATETPRDLAFCAHAILNKEELLIVPDATKDPRFHDNPLTAGDPHVKFYAGAPLITPSGHALGTLCVIDRIPRNLNEQQLDALRRIGRQVLCQLELRKARDQARHLASAKGDFLAAMSHEIRTPLNGVLGMAQLLSETELAPEARKYAAIIQRSGEHLLGVVNDILEFSRLESGRIQLLSEPFNLQNLLQDVVAITSEAARGKGLSVSCEWRAQLNPHRVSDPQRLRQMLLNLVGNAIKFTHAGRVTIRVTEASASMIEIAVLDTGIGIAKEAQSRLFERFSQAESTTSRKYGGTGLGLAISSEIVKLMGGEIGVQSQPGKGSRFWFRIPLPIAAAAGSSRASESAESTAAEYCDLAGRRVLVAEDDGTNAIVIRALLAKCNGVVTTVENGAQAVEHCRRQEFDLILMDGKMPEMDGYEASRQIRQLASPWAQQVPIIALTADALDGDREHCLLAGMSDYVTKPINRKKLNDVLSRAIATRTVADAAVTTAHLQSTK